MVVRCFLLSMCLAAGTARAQLPPELELLARIKQHAADNLSRIPDYVCLETIERFRQPQHSRQFVPVDTVRVEVAEVGNRELFAWPDARPLGTVRPESLIGFGAIGTGTFAGFVRGTFAERGPTFQYLGQEKIDGRPAVRYDFKVSLLMSGFSVDDGKRQDKVAYSGSFWAGPQSLELMRIVVRAEEIPPENTISNAVTSVDYAKTRIGAADFLLPARAELTITDRPDGGQSRNITRFEGCRKYSAESAVSFELPKQTARSPAPAREIVLPADIELALRLESEIDSRQMVVGDPLEARLQAAIYDGDMKLVPAYARVHGRIRRLERVPDITDCYILGIDFSEIDLPDGKAHFAGEMQQFGRLGGASREPVCIVYRSNLISGHQTLRPVPVAGRRLGSLLFISAKHVYIPRGLEMVWRTTARQD